ncbi:hypothetical protein LAZ40_11605 [Cereibacter sphaeroides]|uniref:hypothetical protein n=1 Tax=Cereibacter sphaeroides TaxID=1063 RepID=UPI001F43FC65|nr:hypothetical protein [Cereibacter sphaeroides]MCE6959664.1 hypothetical protein [Cereibacter sphaeroides]MCE6974475.1 hypothetical protein [Cereibacter sphaeroides]
MSEDDLEKMKSVNVLVTLPMLVRLDAMQARSRSHAARRILAATLAAHDDGLEGPLRQSLEAASRTSSKRRRELDLNEGIWRKAIIWIPERMHRLLARHCRGSGLRVADAIRGAVIAYTGEEPYPAVPAAQPRQAAESVAIPA